MVPSLRLLLTQTQLPLVPRVLHRWPCPDSFPQHKYCGYKHPVCPSWALHFLLMCPASCLSSSILLLSGGFQFLDMLLKPNVISAPSGLYPPSLGTQEYARGFNPHPSVYSPQAGPHFDPLCPPLCYLECHPSFTSSGDLSGSTSWTPLG